MSEIGTRFFNELEQVKIALINRLVGMGLIPESEKKLSDSEFYAEHGMTKAEYEEKYHAGSLHIAEMPPDVREAEMAKAREQQEELWDEQVKQMELEQQAREAEKQERIEYARRGGMTQEEYDAHMKQSEDDYYANLEYVETYRGVQIYRHENGSYMARDQGMSAGDLVTLQYMIDSKLDTGSAEDEILQGQQAIYERTEARREPLKREDEISSTTQPVITPTIVEEAEPTTQTLTSSARPRIEMR